MQLQVHILELEYIFMKKKKSKVKLLNDVPPRAYRRPTQLAHVSIQPVPDLGNVWTAVASHMKAPPMRPQFLEINQSSFPHVKPRWLKYIANKIQVITNIHQATLNVIK